MVISFGIYAKVANMASSPAKKDEYTDLDKEIDIETFKDSIQAYFSGIPDPRKGHNLTYKLGDIFFIILAAVLAGANSLNQIAIFSPAKGDWIKHSSD